MSPKGMVLVASVSIFHDDEVLIIKETKPTAVDKWNFPSGQIEYGEDILDSARREVKEETGLEVELTGTTGIYNFISNTNDQVILFHFIGKVTGGSIELEEDVISESMWIKVKDLVNFEDEDLRESEMLRQIFANLLRKSIYPLDVYNEQL